MKKLFAFLIAPFLAASLAYAQPAQWNYTAPGNVSTATYTGNVNILGTCTVQGVSCGGGSTPVNIITTVANIAALRAIGAGAASSPSVYVTDYGTVGSGGGGLFVWFPSSTATADPCITFGATGVATGRYIRQLQGSSLSLQMCGVVADGTSTVTGTDNTTPLQAAFTALSTYNLGEVFCPASSGIIDFSSTINTVAGGTLRGQNNTLNPTLGSTSTAPGSCHFRFNGTGSTTWAFDYQSPFTSGACPNGIGPNFINFTLSQSSTANGFRVNDPSIAGFSDNCAGTGGGQSQVFGTTFDGIVTDSSQRNTTAIQVSKAFDTTIKNSAFSFYDTQIQVIGSDNVLLWNNKQKLATLRAVDLQSRGTYGNFNNIKDSTFFSVYTNATDFIRDSSRSGDKSGNYFETDYSGITSVLNLTCSLSQSWHDNAMELLPAYVSYWLKVTGDCININLANNYGGGGGVVPAQWNGGAGANLLSNTTRQYITAYSNPDQGHQPYTTVEVTPSAANNAPVVAGSVLGTFDATTREDIGGDGASTIFVGPTGHYGDIEFQPKTAGALGHLTWHVRPVVNATVDTWILAYTGAGSNQQFTCTVGGSGAITFTLTGGTTPTWYNPAGLANLAVTDPLVDCVNQDTTHGQFVYFTKMQLVKH